MCIFSLPFSKTRIFLLLRIGVKVIVSRSFIVKFLVVVWAIGNLLLMAFEFGKIEAVWPSEPMPRMVKSKVTLEISF